MNIYAEPGPSYSSFWTPLPADENLWDVRIMISLGYTLINDFAGGGGDRHPASFISDVNIWDA